MGVLALLLAMGLSFTAAVMAQTSEAEVVRSDPARFDDRGPDGAHPAADMRGHRRMTPPWGELSAEDREKLHAMTSEQRHAFIQQKQQAWLATLSPEERAKAEQRMAGQRKRMESLTPKQREGMKQFRKNGKGPDREAMKAKFQAMTAEEREAFREKMQQRRGSRGGGQERFRGN